MTVESLHSILNKENRKKIEYSIMNIKRDKRKYSEKLARQKAIYLADKFKNQKGLKFYMKVAWNLTDEYIDWLADYSMGKDKPSHYFVSVANMKMLE